ncbi:MAG TPA: GAF domain-containing SpoIIE family protein phosphatase [Tepidisphaeraceae bacterium]|nr:GAF domain-containing SpoIIE family protein phosphatase [Tepidisphaeraceae bacterium]
MTATAPSEAGSISAEHLKLVLEVTRALAVTTDLDALLQHIAEATCKLLTCERASIFLHDPATDELVTRVALQSIEIRVPSSAGIVGATFAANAVLHVPAPYDDPRFNREIDRKSGFVTRNILAAPMANLGRQPLGVVQAINKHGGPFDASDLALIQMLADQAGVALQRYQLQLTAVQAAAMRHEMNLARRVQDAMLPKSMPRVAGIESVGWTRPASVTGGDCFDLWETPDGRLAVFLADASGHGLAPTLVVSQVRTLIRAFAEVDPHPRRLLERANARLAADLESERFVTAFIAFLAPDGTLDWCSAGHGPILIRCGPERTVDEMVPSELPLGVMPEMTGDACAPLKLEPGGSLAVVSDGIFEAMNPAGEQFGMERVIQLLDQRHACTPGEIVATLTEAATRWTGQEEPADDQTIVVVRRV